MTQLVAGGLVWSSCMRGIASLLARKANGRRGETAHTNDAALLPAPAISTDLASMGANDAGQTVRLPVECCRHKLMSSVLKNIFC